MKRSTQLHTVSIFFAFLLSTVVGFAPCAGAQENSLDDEAVDDAYVQEIWDPLEPVNRGVFWFNDQLYVYLLRPVSKGYDYVMPDVAQQGVTNFFRNLTTPIDFVSNILQAEFTEAGRSFVRFFVNTVVGAGGFVDIGSRVNLPYKDQDLGSAFGRWGIPHGPYLVLPIIGPSSLRDGIGLVGESFINPINVPVYYTNAFNTDQEWIYLGSFNAVKTIDQVNRRRDTIDAAKEGSLDYYLFVQAAYYQIRYHAVHRETEAVEKSEQLLQR